MSPHAKFHLFVFTNIGLSVGIQFATKLLTKKDCKHFACGPQMYPPRTYMNGCILVIINRQVGPSGGRYIVVFSMKPKVVGGRERERD